MVDKLSKPIETVAIVGAGIGGLAAACALHRHGFKVNVFERAKELGEFGAGLQLGPNSVKVLRALGLGDSLQRAAFEPVSQLSINGVDASLRYREPMKGAMQEKYGAPYLTAYRPDLHRMFCSALPSEAIHLGKMCASVATHDEGALVTFSDGTQSAADVVIGADGIKSAIRHSLFGADEPEFTEMMAWRAIIPTDAVPRRVGPNGSVEIREGEYFSWIGWNGHVICYPIGDGSRVNIFAGHHSRDWMEESWSIPSSSREMIEAYAGWNDAMLRMFEHVEQCYKWGIFDRTPRENWRVGRVVLLGDAAHPTMPTLAQGANMAIEDGYTIAECLMTHRDDPVAALDSFVRLRQPRTARITLQSRQQFRNNLMSPPPPPIPRDWIFAHDATAVSA